MKKTVVVALGGNALVSKGKNSISDQRKQVKKAVSKILMLSKKYNIVITHGNGPQVGNILLRNSKKAYDLPLDVSVAQSQGEIGYLIEQEIFNQAPKKHVIPILTQVLVKKTNLKPSKPIGPYFRRKIKGPCIFFKNKGYRKVVISPNPVHIFESDGIKKLVEHGKIVIACGGGGIPVVKKGKRLIGLEAVIDKDKASALLARQIGAEVLLILTDVKGVAVNYGKKTEHWLRKVNAKEIMKLKKEFREGSMLPKVEAAIDFASFGGKCIITDINHVDKSGGTIITSK